MSEVLSTCSQQTLLGLPNIISSPALEDGPAPSGSPAGQPAGQSGQFLAPASRSPTRVRKKARQTSGTSGQRLSSLFAPASLQQSLESKLVARLACFGSPEYSLTWNRWAIKGQEPICVLRASGHPMSDKDYSGWRSPDSNQRGGAYTDPEKVMQRIKAEHQVNLEDQACLSGWPTATANDSKGSDYTYSKGSHEKPILKLPGAVKLAGWPSPAACSPNSLRGQGQDPEIRKAGGHQVNLQDAARLVAGWSTPKSTDTKGAPYETRENRRSELRKQIFGLTPPGTSAQTGKPAGLALNPAFSLWLMGYPVEWHCCGVQAMRSFRQSRRNSLKPT